ncbi:MAG: hypothetical protein BWY06_02945 [Candidatus Latescibacteria bacterium ADurb.Bin168]|jgi:hypothetical protein|nr:MAG: hypothetical protein BWY06_02945 [Candidatus Latescibacteria bacterium ADurb.Bin168]
MIEQKVGIITNTFLGHESHGIFTFVLDIDTDTSYDVLGTVCLSYRPNGDTDRYNPLIGEAIGKICAAMGVKCWEELKGKTVFFTRDNKTRFVVSIEAPPFVPHGPAYNINDHLGQEVDY